MIVVAGKNNIAVHALNKLVDIVGANSLIALPNRNDDGNDSWQRSFRLAAEKKEVRIESLETLDKKKVRFFLSLEYDRIISPDLFPFATLYNFHFSKLPKYKGMYTSIWPIFFGDDESGVTVHEIDRGIDTGKIYAQKNFKIDKKDRARDLYRKYITNAIELFDDKVDELLSEKLCAKLQQAENSSYFPKDSLDFSKIKINMNCTAWQLQRQIYAFSFREYQLPQLFGKSIVEAEITDRKSVHKPGKVVDDFDDKLVLSTIDYDVVLYADKLSETLNCLGNSQLNDIPRRLKHIAGIHDRNDRGWSPIIVAAYNGNVQAVEYLLNNGADVNDRNHNGTTALMYAKDFSLKFRDKKVFDLLMKFGADPELKDFQGKGLRDYITHKEALYLGL